MRPIEVDVIVIGTGQGGIPLAMEMAERGKETVIFERSRVAGSCINWGCTPSKVFLASAGAAGRAAKMSELGIHNETRVDFPYIMQRVRRIKDEWSKSSERRLDAPNLSLIHAEASFTPQGDVSAGGQEYTAPVTVIDTGSSPFIPPIKGLRDTPYLSDRNFWDIEELPQRCIFLGGGYVGLELGQGLAWLGCEVHIVDLKERVMSTESPDVSNVLQEALERDGVTFHLGVEAKEVQHEKDSFRLHLPHGETLESEALYVATGRMPNSGALNAEEAGIELDEKGFIKVNERLQTTREGVYAIGDVIGQPAFTHVSWEDYRRVRDILDGKERRKGDRVLAYSTFTNPQLGRVGMSMEQARESGFNAREARLELKDMTRALEQGDELGFFQMVIDDDTDLILGATLVGYEAGELIHVFVDLIEAGAKWQVLERAQHIHPTYGENLPSLARQFA
jgi:pyruvate/2-oxoglutarate dehydrogenase complex dihydrolipoamide dehydrogenase (E3) component